MVTRRRMLMVPPAAAAAAVVPAVAREADARRPVPAPAAPEPAHRGPWIRAPYDTYVRNPLVARNTFLQMAPDAAAPPTFEEARRALPEPFWDGHASAIACTEQGVEAGVREPAPPRAGERLRGAVHRPGVQRLHLPVGLVLHDAVRALRGARVSLRPDARQLLRQAAPGRVHLPRDRPRARRRSLPALRSVVDGAERDGVGRMGALPQLRRSRSAGARVPGPARVPPVAARLPDLAGRRLLVDGLGMRDGQPAAPAPPARPTPTRSTTTGA